MRPVGRPVLAAIVAGLIASGGCQPTAPSSGPSSPPSSASGSPTTSAPSETAPAAVDPTLVASLLGPWQAEPLPIPLNFVPRVDQACRANLAADLPVGAVLTVIDARGGGVLQAFYASATGGWASCTPMFLDPLGGVKAERGHIVGAGAIVEVLDPLELEFVEFTWSGEPRITASYLVGRAGAGVARVEIRSPGQPSVVASSANGWWAAWTPGPLPARWRIVALDALGRDVDTVEGVPQDSPG